MSLDPEYQLGPWLACTPRPRRNSRISRPLPNPLSSRRSSLRNRSQKPLQEQASQPIKYKCLALDPPQSQPAPPPFRQCCVIGSGSARNCASSRQVSRGQSRPRMRERRELENRPCMMLAKLPHQTKLLYRRAGIIAGGLQRLFGIRK